MPDIEKQLKLLSRGVTAFAGGDLSHRVQLPAGALDDEEELSQIANGFNAMADQLATVTRAQVLREALIASSTDAIISKTLQGIVTSWNPAAETIFGFTEKEMIGKPISILIPPDRMKEEALILKKILRGERVKNYKTFRRRKSGKLLPMSVTVSPIKDMFGTVIGASKIARDITEYVKATDALKRAEERYQLVMLSLRVGVWDWDLTTNEMYWSPRLRTITGTAKLKTIESLDSFVRLIHPEDKPAVQQQLHAHLNGDSNYDLEYRFRNQARRYVWVHATGQAVRDKSGKPVRMVGSIEDISERKKLEHELVSLVDKLQKSNRDLDDFAYAASHDLKAPLRVIDNTSLWLLEDLQPHLTDDMRENMALLRSRVKRMEKLLDDLLEYSRIGRTQDDRYSQLISGAAMLENIVALLSPPPGFSVVADPGFAQVMVMRMPLQQVLMNLVSNAIKHHDRAAGKVKLGVEEQGHMLSFTVADDGPGIPAQFHEQVFKMFQTLKPRDQVEGSGMGLAMVRKNVETYGGKISLQSGPGRGSLFRFSWPKSQMITGEEA